MESCASVGRILKDDMERTMNEESEWKHNVEDAVGPEDCIVRDEVVQALRERKEHRPPHVSLELKFANKEEGIQEMIELCKSVENAS